MGLRAEVAKKHEANVKKGWRPKVDIQSQKFEGEVNHQEENGGAIPAKVPHQGATGANRHGAKHGAKSHAHETIHILLEGGGLVSTLKDQICQSPCRSGVEGGHKLRL